MKHKLIDSISQIAWQNWLKILNHRSQDKTNVTNIFIFVKIPSTSYWLSDNAYKSFSKYANFILQTSGVILAGLGLAAIGFGGKADLVYFWLYWVCFIIITIEVLDNNKMKNNKYHFVGTMPKWNIKFVKIHF